MRKATLIISAVVLFAGLTFGQTPQKDDKTKQAEKTEKAAKETKSAGCDAKTKAACGESKKAGCCAGHDHSAKKSCTDQKAPEKK